MAESTLSISYADLMSDVGLFLGYKSDISQWTPAEVGEVDRYVQAGIRQFYYPPAMPGVEVGYAWSFLNPVTTLDTVADDASQDLPDGVGRIVGNLFFDDQQYKNSVIQVSEAQVLAMLQRSDDTGCPQYATVRHKAQVEGTGQRLEIVWYPIPDDAYTLTYDYEAYSGKLSNANCYPLGGMKHSELITESCLSIAEQRANDERGLHTDAFQRLLASGVAFDRRQGAQSYGKMGQPQESSYARRRENGEITYDGNTW